jgi:hypothetical protein
MDWFGLAPDNAESILRMWSLELEISAGQLAEALVSEI